MLSHRHASFPSRRSSVESLKKIVVESVGASNSKNYRIPHLIGPFAYENPAIPFLRTGLAVPTREFLHSEDGHAVLETLRLAHGDVRWRYRRAFPVVNTSAEQRRQTSAILIRASHKGEDAVEAMRAFKARGDRSAYLEGAHAGTHAMQELRREVAALYSPEQQKLLQAYLASLHIYDHRHKQPHRQH